MKTVLYSCDSHNVKSEEDVHPATWNVVLKGHVNPKGGATTVYSVAHFHACPHHLGEVVDHIIDQRGRIMHTSKVEMANRQDRGALEFSHVEVFPIPSARTEP